MTQENTKQPESRRSPGSEQGSGSRSAASNPAKPGAPKGKDESACLPCEESRGMTPSGNETDANRGDRGADGESESERRTAPGQQGRTGSTYGGESAEKEMEAEGGPAERRDKLGGSNERSGRPERPSR